MMSAVIDARGLTKQFGTRVAVNHIDLSVSNGQIFGLLGPNAAGKSTTIRLLTGILLPDAGTAQVLGMDLLTETTSIKEHTGYVAQHFALYPELTVTENLSFYSGLYQHISKNDLQCLLERYGLMQFANQRTGTLSGGYKRRLSIACAVSHEPDLIYLDEPTAGIDPVTRKDLWEQFYDLAAAGKTLFVTTHYMEEAERCHQLAFIHQGKLVAHDTPERIKQSLQGYKVFASRVNYDPLLSKTLKSMDRIYVLNQFGEELRIVADSSLAADELNACIKRHTNLDANVKEVPVSIEDAFMTLTRDNKVQ